MNIYIQVVGWVIYVGNCQCDRIMLDILTRLAVNRWHNTTRSHTESNAMTIQQQIDNAREHLASGNDYSYRAQMSAAIRATVSSRSLNQYYSAIEEDGFELLNQFAPVADDIVVKEDRWAIDTHLDLIQRTEHRIDSEVDDDVSDWLDRR